MPSSYEVKSEVDQKASKGIFADFRSCLLRFGCLAIILFSFVFLAVFVSLKILGK